MSIVCMHSMHIIGLDLCVCMCTIRVCSQSIAICMWAYARPFTSYLFELEHGQRVRPRDGTLDEDHLSKYSHDSKYSQSRDI